MQGTRSLAVVALAISFVVLASGCTASAPIEAARSAQPTSPTPASSQPPSSEPPASPEDDTVTIDEADELYQSIRDVDFRNYTYLPGLGFGSEQATVVDGEYANGEFGEEDFYLFGVSEVDIGDLDADGIEEALVATYWNGGGTGYFESVRAFRYIDGAVVAVGEVLYGDRADGGVHEVQIVDGQATVWFFDGGEGACCPNRIAESRLVLGEQWLMEAERAEGRSWISLDETRGLQQVYFEPGTSSGVVSMYGDQSSGSSFLIEAGQGQRMTVLVVGGPAPADISVVDPTTGQVLSGLAAIELPSDAVYEVQVTFDEVQRPTTTLEVIIGNDGDVEPSTRWMPTTEQTLINEEPLVRSSLAWPTFVSSQPGTDAANVALAEYVTSLDDYWVEPLESGLDTALDDSNYELTYDVTLATSDLVSVGFRYYDYVCCRPYPNYGQHGAVLDLAAGRLITDDEILDLDRLAEIQQIWLDEMALESPEFAEAFTTSGGPLLDSVNLAPGGVQLGTDRSGALPGTTTVVPFDQLGDLVNPEIVARVTNG